MQVLMLAAGMGKRLKKYTKENTKCMIEVNDEKLIDRAIEAVQYANLKRMIIVIGFEGENLKKYILNNYCNCGIEFVFVENKDYDKTNNIYSFYLAKEYLIQDDTILLESDIIYDKNLISNIVQNKNKNIAVIAKYRSWMDGTVVTINENSNITNFLNKSDINFLDTSHLYKTVNIYKFSKEFLEKIYFPILEVYMKVYGLNNYYESVLNIVSHLSKTDLYGYEVGDMDWYEIDDVQDLDIAKVMFAKGKNKYNLMISKFGGYWRYEKILDFCYLVNPYFPTKQYKEKLIAKYDTLLGSYPSGMKIQSMNAERIFGIDENHIIVGNGAAELINVLGLIMNGKIAVGLPTFNEYIRCFRNCEIVKIDNSEYNYEFNIQRYLDVLDKVNALFIVSPDNPSGAMLNKEQVELLCEKAQKNNTLLVIDESFIDFADEDKRYTLICDDFISKYNNLIVIRSIGKSYGVAGLRLGVLATSNDYILEQLKKYMQIWNINSMAEYFLQTFNLYSKEYVNACNKISKERAFLYKKINEIDGIKAHYSHANFIMINLGKNNSTDFCVNALSKYNILIKDLSTKDYFNKKNYIRVAVKDREQNESLIQCMKELLG